MKNVVKEEVKITAIVRNGKKVIFSREAISEMVSDKSLYIHADNLPKWMRIYGGFKSWKAVWTMLGDFLSGDENITINVRSDL
jgi:hypothetical protein